MVCTAIEQVATGTLFNDLWSPLELTVYDSSKLYCWRSKRFKITLFWRCLQKQRYYKMHLDRKFYAFCKLWFLSPALFFHLLSLNFQSLAMERFTSLHCNKFSLIDVSLQVLPVTCPVSLQVWLTEPNHHVSHETRWSVTASWWVGTLIYRLTAAPLKGGRSNVSYACWTYESLYYTVVLYC